MAALDALLCEYGDETAAGAGRKQAEAWVGSAVTGASLARGRVVLAVADRGRADPNGKTIHKLTQAFLRP